MSFRYHGLSSTDYHVTVQMQENKEKALSEYTSLTLIPWACKTYSLGYSMWQICRTENSLKTKIWGKQCIGSYTKKLEKVSSYVKIEISRCFLDSLHIEQRMSSGDRCPVFPLHRLKSIRKKTFIVMLYHKADSLLLRYNIYKYQLSLSKDIFVKSTLRSNYPWSFYTMKPS